MEGAALLRSSLACSNRLFFSFRPAFYPMPSISRTPITPHHCPTHFAKRFSSLSPRAIATPFTHSPSEFSGVSDEVAEQLGFEKVSEEFIGECKSKALLFRHKKTGAQVISVSNDDENKVFGIVFRTPPNDSTGIPHILEHSVLCGSRKYPLKEPFVELLKGSLHTFLNAFTYPDRTCYPVASTNSKDFYNLVDVYLDAVFFPKCVEDFQTFQQEGWHYELNNPSEEISYKGVVFNEMKGVYSQPDNILGRLAQQANNTYGVDSGGDPKVIPKLTYEEFKEFHRKYYHPSNARIWFYGDDDPTERLRILSEYLDMFDASSAPNESRVQTQKLFSEPVRISEKYPAGEGKHTGSFPRGLSLMLRSMGKWIYDMDPFQPLKYEKPLLALKARLEKEGSKAVFSPLIEKFILNNPHRVVVEMQPDPEKASRDEAAEKEILEKVKAGMTEEDLAELARATQELRLKQETPDPPEALRSVPSLSLHDIPKEPITVPTEVGNINGVKVLQHDLFTNDVLYTEVVFNMKSLKQELLPLVPLFCQSLLEMGTKDLSFVQLNQLIGRKTGGISVYPLTSSVRGKEDPCSHIIVRGKAMAGRADDLFHLINCILQEVQFTDQQRFKQFVSQSKARMENRLRGSGHGIAAARMDAKLNVAGWISEQMGGFSYLEFLQSLEEKNLANSEKFVGKFLDLLPNNSPLATTSWNARLPSANEAIVIPTQVNYVGKAANIYDTGYQLNGSAYVIHKYISNTWLWDRVRVSGGAYGGFCDFDSHSGVFSFLSYRDPNLLKTLDIYDGTGEFLRQLELDDETLTKAIIGTIGEVDSYQLPDAKGYSSLMRHLLGVSDEDNERKGKLERRDTVNQENC
ncbi:hypothetical protein M0R45_007833 [Rubus argutus]|uniref:Peptidase M16C associated domain-containing protein n=1 Tax=Rubus argutus TaxID=59490 RepID=A0AAW1Y2E2_RUBAR